MTAREAAFVSLQKYETSGKYTNIEADAAIRRNGLEGADRALYTAIFYGTVERKITLDYRISQLSARKPDDIDANVRIILRMSLYQMIYLDRVPDYAILDEAGAICRRFAADSAVAFINGVLRAWQRKGASLPLPDEKKEPVRYLSVRYSYPEWLCAKWVSDYGYRKTARIFEAFDENPPITLRVNTRKTTRDALLSLLRDKTIGCAPTQYAEDGIRLSCRCPIEQIPGLSEGLCFVEDESSQLCVSVFDPQPGEHILDACACPGGKSFSSAMLMRGEGEIVSCDLHENKLRLVSRGAELLGLENISVSAHDGTVFDASFEGAFDRVLCDVPCSGLGVLSKKPDIRHKQPSDIERLPGIQYAILSNCARYVRPGGTLVYSTCTLNREENEDNVRRFLSEHADFSPVPITVSRKGIVREDGMLTVFPDDFPGCDGFFMAKLIKVT